MTVVPALDGPTGTDHRVLRLGLAATLALIAGQTEVPEY